METLIRLNSQTSGRDKVFRLCQYSCRFLWPILENANEIELAKKLKELETLLGSGRKLLRFGRGVDVMYGALSTISLPDPVIRTSVTLSKIASSLYLLSDHLVWLAKSGLVGANKDKWNETSNRFWLYSIVMNLVRDFYEIVEILKQDKRNPFLGIHAQGRYVNLLRAELRFLVHFVQIHRNVSVDTLKNICDVWIPLHSLNYVNISPALLGLLGIISSAASILQILDYSYRLSPS